MRARPPRTRTEVRDAFRAHDRAWRAAYGDFLPESALPPADRRLSDEQTDRFLAGVADPDRVLLVALDGEQACGFADARTADTKSFVGPDAAELRAIYVDPEAWGEGAGTALLDGVLDGLPDGVASLSLEVFAANDVGRSFYESRGFERTGESTYELDGDAYPTLLYERPV